MAKLIKEIRLSRSRETWIDNPVAVVRDGGYGSSLAKFDRLFDELLKTFPDASRETVEIKHYGGQYYAGTFGIEYSVPHHIYETPEGWTAIRELELVK